MLTAPNAPKFIVRGDIKAFYATVQHDWFMKHIIMDKEILQEFLNAGHVFAGELFPSNGLGISEGSNIAPILSNLILNGLQKHIYDALGASRTKDFANGRMVRYVDDVIFTVRSEYDGKKVIAAMESFLL